MIDFRNPNTLWASIIAETWYRLGLKTAVLCPGSRSTPLTLAFAQHPDIEAIPILDERTAAFFALGMAKKSGLPTVLVCTSGTAGANFYPAVIEARESRVPLMIITADRPAELRHCHAGQTIDQVKFYGNYPNWQIELAIPELGLGMLRYLRQNLVQAWVRSRYPVAGVVHLNCPLREPLAPITQVESQQLADNFDIEAFFAGISPLNPVLNGNCPIDSLLDTWKQCSEGIIIAGVDHTAQPWEYCRAIARLSEYLGWAVLGEALSPIRNHAGLNPYLISTYDSILRQSNFAALLQPKMVIQIGELPTSKELRLWLETNQPHRWIITPDPDNFDPIHGNITHCYTTIEQISERLQPVFKGKQSGSNLSPYLKHWCQAEKKVRSNIDQALETTESIIEAKVAWLLSQYLPAATPIFIANSMPVRYAEFFWKPKNTAIIPYFNRGANGIDGTLATALGIAHHSPSSVLLTGDLALLHDTNGFLLGNQLVGHLTIILINNNGGGIFEMLPIANFEPPFEDFFATPQNIDFEKLCVTYGVEYQLITNWQQLQQLINPLPRQGIRVLEVRTNRKVDAQWLKEYLPKFSN